MFFATEQAGRVLIDLKNRQVSHKAHEGSLILRSLRPSHWQAVRQPCLMYWNMNSTHNESWGFSRHCKFTTGGKAPDGMCVACVLYVLYVFKLAAGRRQRRQRLHRDCRLESDSVRCDSDYS